MKNVERLEKTDWTYGDYCSWPEDERWELINGEAFDMTPAPSRSHSLISNGFLKPLFDYFEGKSCEVHDAPFDVRLPRGNESDNLIDTVVQPDILVVCDEKKLDEKGCRGAPDLAIEILSPSTASRDSIRKRALYEKHGVKEYWVVDPNNRLVYRYVLGQDGAYGKPQMYDDAGTIDVELFPGLTIDLKKVFPSLPPKIVRESPRTYQAPAANKNQKTLSRA